VSKLELALDELSREPVGAYRAGDPAASEPTALSAMALAAHGRPEPARAALDWLAALQSDEGSVGISPSRPRPRWATGWAVLAWQTALRLGPEAWPAGAPERWRQPNDRAVAWMQSLQGETLDDVHTGHDTSLRGWPWVETTHSWAEPTAIAVLALKAAGHPFDLRVREAVAMLLDRVLPDGGWNYGNTAVLGNTLRAHVQPTGLALAALHDERAAEDHVRASIAYLERALARPTACASLCYAVLGAAAHGHRFAETGARLEAAARSALERDPSPYKLALLSLARLGEACPWFTPTLQTEHVGRTSSPSENK